MQSIFTKTLIGLFITSSIEASAQPIPDATLPENTRVEADLDAATFSITGGTLAGKNLFHSFESFDIQSGSSVIFNSTPAAETIFSRVTGSSPSNIDGQLRVDGTSNLFLINPNGIIFGTNASLDLGGSFLATTADSISFDNNQKFSASVHNSDNLLDLSTPIGLQFGSNPGLISNLSKNRDVMADRPTGLQVKPNQTIALIGGAVEIPGGHIISPQSKIEISSVADNSFIGLLPTQQGFHLDYETVEQYKDIKVSQLAQVNASGNDGGAIKLHGDRITITGGSQILSRTQGNGRGAGIQINATEALEVLGTGPLDGPRDEVIWRFLEVHNPQRSSVSTNNFSTGIGGNIQVNAKRVSIRDGGDISVRALNTGLGGNLSIKAPEQIEIVGDTAFLGLTTGLQQRAEQFGIDPNLIGGAFSASFIIANSLADGNSGTLTLETGHLLIRDGGLLSANPFGNGNGGDILITATEAVELIGTPVSEAYSPGISIGPGRPFVQGRSGNLVINSPKLRILGGSGIGLSTSNSSGALGIFNISETTEIIGTSPTGKWLSSISALSTREGTGGKIELVTDQLKLSDGGTLLATGANLSIGGDIKVIANSVLMDNHASITTASEGLGGGFGGNINLQVSENLLLRRNSSISAQAGNAGNGGNISINADFIIAIANENSDIIANAVAGRGGEIALSSNSILGLEVNNSLSPNSDINASSEIGIDGTVTINAPDTDINPEQIELNGDLATPSLSKGCLASLSNSSGFIHTARGGLPVHPTTLTSVDNLWQDSELLDDELFKDSIQQTTNLRENRSSNLKISRHNLEEAHTWKHSSNGEIKLVSLEKTTLLLEAHLANLCSPQKRA